MIRRPPRSTLFPTRRSSDLELLLQQYHRSRNDPFALAAIEQKLSEDRKSTRLNSSHANISYAVFCLKKKKIAAHSRTDAAHAHNESPGPARRHAGSSARATH